MKWVIAFVVGLILGAGTQALAQITSVVHYSGTFTTKWMTANGPTVHKLTQKEYEDYAKAGSCQQTQSALGVWHDHSLVLVCEM